MSAIAGLYRRDGRAADGEDLERMVTRVTHRGPDGGGTWLDGSLGLGHRLLHTTPESLHEKLPLFDTTGDLILTADARIDNRAELIRTLALTGRPPSEITDSELILGAYARWGHECPAHLLGDFAFAVWDRHARALFCARDPFGVKPFYYHAAPLLFAFASGIEALLALPEVPRRLNETRVAEYLAAMTDDRTGTFWEDILRLPPGHAMVVRDDTLRAWSYWALDPTREIRFASDEAYAEAFRECFTGAVRCRLRSAGPVGAMLSGGVDSSSVVCVARHLRAEDGRAPVPTFSAIFPDLPACDERPFIDAVVAQGGIEPHYVRGDQLNPLAELKEGPRREDEAFDGADYYMRSALCRAARASGVRVVLEGTGGDTVVSHGTGYLPELAQSGRWIALAREVAALARGLEVSPWAVLWWTLQPLAPDPVRTAWRGLRRRGRPPWDPIVSGDLARRIGLADRVERLVRAHRRLARSSRTAHWRGLASANLPSMLDQLDRFAAEHVTELRFPFLDTRLVELCLALPADQKLRNGWTRMILRRAMRPLLPDAIQGRRGKTDLHQMLHTAFSTFGRERLETVLSRDVRAIAMYVDQSAVRRAYDRYTARGNLKDGYAVWRAATLALGLRRARLTE